MFKIAVLQISQSQSHGQYLEGLNALKGMAARSGEPGSVEIKVFVTGGTEKYNIARKLESIRQYEPDALFSVGATCSLAAKKFFRSSTNNLPIVFMGVLNPSKIGLVSNLNRPDDNITGVLVETPPDELPIQALTKLRPGIKRLIFVYREEVFRDRISFEISCMEKYVHETGRKTLFMPFRDGGNCTQRIEDLVEEGDGIVIPKQGVSSADLEKIDLACKNNANSIMKCITSLSGQE